VDSEWAYIERDWVTRGGAHSSVLLLGLGVEDCKCDKLPVYKCCSAGCFKSRTLTWERLRLVGSQSAEGEGVEAAEFDSVGGDPNMCVTSGVTVMETCPRTGL